MTMSIRRIAGAGVALAAAAGLALPGIANAEDASPLASLDQIQGLLPGGLGTAGIAPTVTADSGEDGAELTVTLSTGAAVGEDADAVACAAQIIGPDATDVPSADDLAGDEDVLLQAGNAGADDTTAEKTVAVSEYEDGEYVIASACWNTDDGDVVEDSAVGGVPVLFTVDDGAAEVVDAPDASAGLVGSAMTLAGIIGDFAEVNLDEIDLSDIDFDGLNPGDLSGIFDS